MFSNDSRIGMFLDRLGNDPTLQMLTAILVMLMAAAVIVFVVGRKKEGHVEPPIEEPGDPEPDDVIIDDPIPGGFRPEEDDRGGHSASGDGKPGDGEHGADDKSREAEEKGPFKKSPGFKDTGGFRSTDPDSTHKGLRSHGMDPSPYAREKKTTAPEVEMFYTYKEPVHIRLCPYCGCENSFMAQRCECCGEDMLQRKGRYE